MTGPLDGGRGGGGGHGDDARDEARGEPRIPAPRAAGDDLTLSVPPFPLVLGAYEDEEPEEEPDEAAGGDVAGGDAMDGTAALCLGPGAGDRPADMTHNADDADAARTADPADTADTAHHTTGGTDTTGGTEAAGLSHSVLKSLLGAWALAVCSAEETAAVEVHLGECAACADEALRLRDAVGLLHMERDLDLDPLLRFRVLENCLGRRPARIPVPAWAAPYDAETARLDALLRDFGDSEWDAEVRLRWFEGDRQMTRSTSVAQVLGHLMAVDGLVAGALGLGDPLGTTAPPSPEERTEQFWKSAKQPLAPAVRQPWRGQSHTLIRTVSFAGRGVSELSVSYGDFSLALKDSLLDRAFECWIHAGDIADAVDYPYEPPSGVHLNLMIDLAARLLPHALAARRRAGLASPPHYLMTPGAPGRSLHLEIEGAGGGSWHIALDSPAANASADHAVAQVALEAAEFCRLAAGHISPEEAAAGQDGDREAIREVLFATASLSRL
ncbi:zf-HC2 domain-containing protein [Streptomyces sp. MUM 178J]|uniref:zf-HC2 domain-containing protein n=1 Tax=Streptomyces sp. MUM 178J TaxID=2791991 RepID=UPI001F03487C|nr:zf-HC2 domain-containing protein [Streptomyces sp. MUM 178J]WRQ82768.1 zf-HC2 domain-containing protein [Streptomyces sp. MUM 178J]